MTLVATVIILLAAIAVLSQLAQRIHVPYPTVMVLVGLSISFVPWLPTIHVPPDVLFLVFLPPLLFAAAWRTAWIDFRRNIRPILGLAIGYVLVLALCAGAAMHYLVPDLPWAAAFALGAIIAPPDPIAAASVLTSMGVSRRLTTVLEGESLINDAAGLTFYSLAVLAAVTGKFSAGHAAVVSVTMVGGGIAIGFVLGYIALWIHGWINDPRAETVMTLLSPFAAYLAADAAGMSGVLSTVVMGLVVSRQAPFIFGSLLRLRSRAVWDTMNFVLTGVVFIIIGLQMNSVIDDVSNVPPWRLVLYVAVLLGLALLTRVIWVFGMAYVPRFLWHCLSRRSCEPGPPWREVGIASYTGMRGVVSLAAALALPFETADHQPFPHRGLIIFLTFMVIVGTLVPQSLTLPFLVRWLKVGGHNGPSCAEWTARLQAVEAALVKLGELEKKHAAPPPVLQRLRNRYEARAETLSAAAEGQGSACGPPEDEARQVQRELLRTERLRVLELFSAEEIGADVLDRIEMDLDLEELRLRDSEAEQAI